MLGISFKKNTEPVASVGLSIDPIDLARVRSASDLPYEVAKILVDKGHLSLPSETSRTKDAIVEFDRDRRTFRLRNNDGTLHDFGYKYAFTLLDRKSGQIRAARSEQWIITYRGIGRERQGSSIQKVEHPKDPPIMLESNSIPHRNCRNASDVPEAMLRRFINAEENT